MSTANDSVRPIPRAVDAAGPVFQEFFDGGNSPQGIAIGPDGNFWISEANTCCDLHGQITRMTPAGVFTNFVTSDTNAQFVTRGPDGNMWFTEATNQGVSPFSTAGHIGRITMSGQVTEFALPTPFNRPYAIAAGGDGNVWFTEDGSKVGRITPSGQITEFAMPTQQGLADDLTLGPDGNMWFPQSQANKLTRVERNGHMTEYDLPAGSGPEGIVTGPDGNLWIVQSGSNKIARFSIRSNSLTEFPIPTANSDAQLITAGPDGNLWFTEAIVPPNRLGIIGRITPTGSITEFIAPPATRRAFDEPFKIIAGPNDGKMWFTEEHSGEIVSLAVPTGVTGFQEPGTVSRVRHSDHQPPPISELSVPENNLVSPFAVTKGSDGNVWFTEQYNAAIGRITPDGKVTEFPATGGIESITSGPDGALWYCGINGGVVRFTTSAIEKDFTIPSNSCNFIVTGGDGNLWYTSGGNVGRLTASGVATEFSIQNDGPIVAGPNGNVWVTNTAQFAQSGVFRRISPTGDVTDFPMTGFSASQNTNTLAIGPDGNIWVVGTTTAPNPSGFTSVIGRLTLATGEVTSFSAGTRLALTIGIISGPDGNLWFDFGGNDTGPAGITRMTTTGVITARMLLPAGFATPQGITVGPALGRHGRNDQSVWVAESGTDRFAVVNAGS